MIEPSFSQRKLATSAPIVACDAHQGSESTKEQTRLKSAQPKAIDPKPPMPDTVLGKRKEGEYITILFSFKHFILAW